MEFWDTLNQRRSIRDYTDEPVERDIIERLVTAAISAPSSMNRQPWRFHVCTGTARVQLGEILAQATVHLADYMEVLGPEHYERAMQWYSDLGNAPVVIGVSSPLSTDELETINTMLSVGAAIENLMLAAVAEGLGTCSLTFGWWVRDQLAGLFELGEDSEIIALLTLGHPALATPDAHADRNPDVVDWLG